MKYQEYNRNTLKEALSRLPEHQPPDNLWARIESGLEVEEQEEVLQNALEELPAYSPPPSVWENIEKGLERQEKTPRLRRLRWVAAASVAVLVAWSIAYLSGGTQPRAVYSYGTEKANPGMLANNWDADEEAMNAVVEAFSRDPLAKRQQQYGRLLDEWQELEEARAEIKEIMELYGKDARLARQMGEIERERSKLAKAMAMTI